MAVGKGLKFTDLKEHEIEKFLSAIRRDSSCWYSTLNHGRDGYPRIWIGGKSRRASHVAYVVANGDFPPNKLLMHSCDNRACINPAHLAVATDKENIIDRDSKGRNANKAKTHCKNGHEFTEENTLIRKRKEGGRKCRNCHRIRALKNYHSGNIK